ncbi:MULTISPECIES: hypothetical protein [unclassified Streptomyces]|uniref:Uncharacterized protein n=1 Tax=Streptomyces millisiae TaxID=3075542 RepID=A0ABU2LSA7_9ACTN|nr:hypothetical protein [Streptomyces sp. DSM 44918]MDT0320481.1 hypothetical protein [Streptomyces sp. DSM 44918]
MAPAAARMEIETDKQWDREPPVLIPMPAEAAEAHELPLTSEPPLGQLIPLTAERPFALDPPLTAEPAPPTAEPCGP